MRKNIMVIMCAYLLCFMCSHLAVAQEIYAPKTKEYLIRLLKDPHIPLSAIDTSNFTDMSRLFENTTRKDFSGIESWNVSNVVDMSYMFSHAKFFNHNINDWNVSNVVSMSGMFYEASSFNQPLDKWNVSKVRFMFGVFFNAKAFNQPLNSWNVSNVEGMGSMFAGASSFNQPLDKWDTQKVLTMRDMFHNAKSFNQDISMWNISKVKNKTKMLYRSGMQQIPVWYKEEFQKEQEIDSMKKEEYR